MHDHFTKYQELEDAASNPAPPRIFMFEGDQVVQEHLVFDIRFVKDDELFQIGVC